MGDTTTAGSVSSARASADSAVTDSASTEAGSTERVRLAYDTVARAYDTALRNELDGKPLDRALLESFTGLAPGGTIADVGCGPGHVTRFLADRHGDVVGVDLSPRMIEVARERAPELSFVVGSMLRLPVADGTWAGIVALYSIIHLTIDERAAACREFSRVICPGGWLLLAFHIDRRGGDREVASGESVHLTDWFGEQVDLDSHFLDPADVTRNVEAAGFTIVATTVREPWPLIEYPSRRGYILAQRS